MERMMRWSTHELVRAAQQGGYALGAFNIYNLEGIRAVIEAAEAERSPVLLQIHPYALQYGGRPLVQACLTAARNSEVPVAVHLDHCTDVETIEEVLALGVHSVMADGSSLSYAANVAFTVQVVAAAHAHGAAVEAELGKISGTEDGLTVAAHASRMTDPHQAADFATRTGVELLAICIGNVHGPYPGEPQLDFSRLEHIRNLVHVPLVLHGASGLPEAAIRRSIELGICKFNVNTELRQAYLQTLRSAPPDADLLDIMQGAVQAMKQVAREKMQLFGSSGRVS